MLVSVLINLVPVSTAAYYADDFDFDYTDISTTPTASIAESYQDSMGYDADDHTDYSANTAHTLIESDAIFFFNGHGYKEDS